MSSQLSPTVPSRRHSSGFTLVELMITVAVIAVLIGIGFPSFSASMRSNRIATHANEMIASVSLARSEAIKSNVGAGICATADNATCGTNWNTGWLVFTDTDGNGVPGAGEVVRVISGNPSLTMTEGAGLGKLMFNNRGMATAAAVQTFNLTPLDCPTGRQVVRNFSLNLTGQIAMTKAYCP